MTSWYYHLLLLKVATLSINEFWVHLRWSYCKSGCGQIQFQLRSFKDVIFNITSSVNRTQGERVLQMATNCASDEVVQLKK
jgi:hypothetical protein